MVRPGGANKKSSAGLAATVLLEIDSHVIMYMSLVQNKLNLDFDDGKSFDYDNCRLFHV